MTTNQEQITAPALTRLAATSATAFAQAAADKAAHDLARWVICRMPDGATDGDLMRRYVEADKALDRARAVDEFVAGTSK